MSENIEKQRKPIICTFRQLAFTLRALHLWQKKHVDTLHDCWTRGTPTPNTIIRNPKQNDPRKAVAGNFESRIVFPKLLAKWVTETANEQGIAMTPDNAYELLNRVQIAFSGDVQELVKKAN